MAKKLNQQIARNHIAEIVAEMLITNGIEKTTLREVARRSGYSRSLIEQHFGSKSELIAEAFRWIGERALARGRASSQGLSGLAALRKLNQVNLPVSEETVKEWEIRLQIWGFAIASKDYQREQFRRTRGVEKIVIGYLKEAQSLGELSMKLNLPISATRFVHGVYGLGCNAILCKSFFTQERQYQALDYIIAEISQPSI